jgi:hypothetical protein
MKLYNISDEACSSFSFKPYRMCGSCKYGLLNIFQAASSGCDIVTVTSPLLKKLQNVGKDLDQLSLETVEMFYNDAKTAGYSI